MTSPARTVAVDDPLPAIVKRFESDKVSAFPVIDGDTLVGILSSTDLVRARAQGTLTADQRARDCMTREVISVREDAQLDEAARRMTSARVHRLVVVDAHEHPVGIVSTRDLLRDVAAAGVQTPLEALMTREVITIDVGDPIHAGTSLLAESNIRGLVVTEGQRPVGVFTHTEAIAARSLPPSLQDNPIETVMSHETICFDAGVAVHHAAEQAIHMDVRRLLVVRHRKLVGILSCLDLIGVLCAPNAT